MNTLQKKSTPKSKSISPSTSTQVATLTPPPPPSSKSKSTKPTQSTKNSPSNQPNYASLTVSFDVGFGNTLFIRGEGSPSLSWYQGTPLQNQNSNTWTLQIPTSAPISFKLLINDSSWSSGENFSLQPGQSLHLSPSF